MFSRHTLRILAAGAVLTLAGGAYATTILNNGSGELSLIQVLGQAYGYTDAQIGSSNLSGTVSYSSGANSISFQRISDSGGAAGNLLINGTNLATDDSQWQDGNPTFIVEAKYARYAQVLGWRNVAGGNVEQDLLRAEATTATALTPTVTTLNSISALSTAFDWFDKPLDPTTLTAIPPAWYSDPTLNASDTGALGSDHMVTFWISPGSKTAGGALINSGNGAFLIGFEDLPLNNGSDRDYNDLVVQVSAVPGGGTGNSIPLPPAAWAGLGMLAALGGARLISQRRSRRA